MVESLNRQRVLNFLDVFYSGDIEGALARCSDDIAFFSNAPIDILPHMGQHHGKDAVRKVWQTIRSRYSDMRHEVRSIVAEKAQVSRMPTNTSIDPTRSLRLVLSVATAPVCQRAGTR